jgi:alpha-mannosidase
VPVRTWISILVMLKIFREPKVVKAVNMLEEEDEGVKKELKKEGERIKLKMKPFEIVTLKVKK